jgi:Flp pilus assembly protein TadD
MYRRCAETGRGRLTASHWLLGGCLVASLLALAACGGSPTVKSEPNAEAVTTAGAPAAAVTTAPASTPVVTAGETQKPSTSKSAKSKAAVADAATQAAPVEAPIPPEAQQQFDKAVTAMSSGNLALAEQSFRSLAAAYPAYSGPLLNLGILQAKAGNLDDAEKTLNEAVTRNGNSAASFNQLGIVYRRLGRFKEADEAYQHALRIDPGYALAYLNLGVLCDLYLQQPQRALESYERYLELVTTPDAKVSSWVTELKTRLASQPRSARTE